MPVTRIKVTNLQDCFLLQGSPQHESGWHTPAISLFSPRVKLPDKLALPITPMPGQARAQAAIPMQEAHLEDSILRLAPELRGAACPPPAPGALPLIDVWHATSGARIRMPGTALHAALAWQAYFLLLLGDAGAAQGCLHLQLVTRDLRPLDSATLVMPGAWQAPGPLVLSHPDHIVFCFPAGGPVWRVSLFPSFRLRLPGLSEPADVQRRVAWRRHFGVARID